MYTKVVKPLYISIFSGQFLGVKIGLNPVNIRPGWRPNPTNDYARIAPLSLLEIKYIYIIYIYCVVYYIYILCKLISTIIVLYFQT